MKDNLLGIVSLILNLHQDMDDILTSLTLSDKMKLDNLMSLNEQLGKLLKDTLPG